MVFKELVKTNRSYRGYDENYRFTKEELMDYVDHARLAASSVNAQPLKYYIAWEKDEVDKIQKETGWARALPELELPHKGMCPTGFIIICQDKMISDNLAQYQKDVGITAQTMLLAAAEKGLGGCMIGSFQAGSVRRTLGLSDNLAPLLIVAFGKPAEKVVLTEYHEGDCISYYRDEKDVHYVPKRRLEDIVIHRK